MPRVPRPRRRGRGHGGRRRRRRPAPRSPATDGAPATHRAPVSAVIGHRVDEFLAPELDPSLAPPESVVHLPLGRVIGSTLLGGSTIWAIVLVAIIAVGVSTGQLWVLFSFVPAAIGLVSYVWSRITKSLRYSIAGTPDGVRIGHGLLSTGNQTIPPGRIHAIEATQWILWRPFGWWSIRINVAGPVGEPRPTRPRSARSCCRSARSPTCIGCSRCCSPMPRPRVDPFVDAGLTGRDGAGGFSRTPRRARVAPAVLVAAHRVGRRRRRRTHPSWLARCAASTFVPLARMQSVAVTVGPDRSGCSASRPCASTRSRARCPRRCPSPTATEAGVLFERLADEAVERAASDTSHHWGAVAGAVGSEAADAR